MKRFPFIWRKTAEDETAVWKTEADRQRRRAERAEATAGTEVRARRQIAGLYSDLFDEHAQAVRRIQSLCVQLEDARNAASAETKARQTAARIARLQKAVATGRAEAAAARAERKAVQRQLDDALGLNTAAVDLGESWQARREQRMRFDTPATTKASAS